MGNIYGNKNLIWLYILIIFICMVGSAICSAADLVYGVVDKTKLSKEAEKGHKFAKLALKIASDYELSISSILFGNNVVNIVASSFLAVLGAAITSEGWGTTMVTAIFTTLLIVFCEFLPKAIAKRYSYSLSKLFVVPVLILQYSPTIIIVWPISKIFKLVGKIFKKKSLEEETINEDVLTEMVDTMEESDELESGEAKLVRSAIDLNDIQAFEIMTPRVDVFAINVDDDIKDIIKDGELFKHSRIPLYKDTIDNIIGILPIKSLLKASLKDEEIDLLSLSYKPLFIPRNHQVLDLLEEFKKSRIHIAIVVDEYGGIEGIVTMEDILEEIVGEIFDESDKIEEQYIAKGRGIYIVDGSMNIDDLFELIGYTQDFETDYSTASGFCQEILDKFAKKGDKFLFAERYQFKILEADEFTSIKIKIKDLQYKREEN